MPVIEIDLEKQPLFRIHRSSFGPIYYNRPAAGDVRYRFDAPNQEFGVLYGAFTFSACIFETVIRKKFENMPAPLRIGFDELEQRSISRIVAAGARPVRLADLTQPLGTFGASTLLTSVDEYEGPNIWSLAIHDADQQLDGIYFRSRFSGEACVAIFNRCATVEIGAPTALVGLAELDRFLDRHQIVVA